jgi:hypothetical protein
MLWMDKSEAGADVSFDSRFLGISDPFRDPKILDWKDYTETWELDENGAVQQGREGGRPAAMIPLALYSLDHPRVPLLLVDFRDSGRARRREVVRRAADDVATGVFGLTGFGNWTYLAAKTSWSFIHNRHGAALDRDARLRATVLLKQELLENHYLSPALRRELARHLDKLEINPLGQSVDSESTTARLQYETLKREAQQGRFAARLAVLRNRDAAAIGAGPKSSTAVRLARVASLGLYRPQPAVTPELLAQADLARRIAWHRRYLENVLAAGPRPEISFDMRQVMRSVNQLVTLSAPYVTERDRTARMISALMANTGDSTAVAECAQGLNRLAIAMTDGAGTPSPAMTPIIETRGVGGQ